MSCLLPHFQSLHTVTDCRRLRPLPSPVYTQLRFSTLTISPCLQLCTTDNVFLKDLIWKSLFVNAITSTPRVALNVLRIQMVSEITGDDCQSACARPGALFGLWSPVYILLLVNIFIHSLYCILWIVVKTECIQCIAMQCITMLHENKNNAVWKSLYFRN